jgi:hypothetical protein
VAVGAESALGMLRAASLLSYLVGADCIDAMLIADDLRVPGGQSVSCCCGALACNLCIVLRMSKMIANTAC